LAEKYPETSRERCERVPYSRPRAPEPCAPKLACQLLFLREPWPNPRHTRRHLPHLRWSLPACLEKSRAAKRCDSILNVWPSLRAAPPYRRCTLRIRAHRLVRFPPRCDPPTCKGCVCVSLPQEYRAILSA